MKPLPGEMFFSSDSYMSFSAIHFNSKKYDDPSASFLLEWKNADEFAKRLRKAADFIDKYKKNHYFEVNID
jgi:hypothetical protein